MRTFLHQIITSWVKFRIEILKKKQLGDKLDWSMTLGELLDNITQLVIFIC